MQGQWVDYGQLELSCCLAFETYLFYFCTHRHRNCRVVLLRADRYLLQEERGQEGLFGLICDYECDCLFVPCIIFIMGDNGKGKWYDFVRKPVEEELKLREFFVSARKAQMN